MRHILKILFSCIIGVVQPATAQVNTDVMLNVGKNALYFHDYALSIQYFSLVASAKPFLYEPWFYRGLAKFYLEDYLGAELDFDQTVKLNPYFTDTYQLRGISRIHNGKFNDAIDDLRKCIAVEPTNDKGYRHNITYCFLQMDSLKQADTELDTILTKWPDYNDAIYMKAEVLLKQENWEEANGYLDQILKIEPKNINVLKIKTNFALKQKKYDEALLLTEEILAINPESINTWNLRANILLYEKRYKEAVEALTASLKRQPQDVRNLISRAICYYYLNDLRGQMNDYDAIIKVDPYNFFAHYNRGQLRAYVGDDNRAIEDFNYILRKDPDDIMTIYNRAILRDKTGDYKGAIQDYTTIIKHFPKYTQGYQLRAEARRKIGDNNGATKDEEHVLKEQIAQRYGYSTPTTRMPNRTMRRRQDIDLDSYQQLVADEDVTEKEPDELADVEPEVYESEYRGRIQNKKVEAKLLSEINYNGEIDPEALKLYNDGCATAKAGDPDHAILQFTQAVALQSDFGEAYFNRGLLSIFKGDVKDGLKDMSLAGQLGIYSAYSIIKQYNKVKDDK